MINFYTRVVRAMFLKVDEIEETGEWLNSTVSRAVHRSRETEREHKFCGVRVELFVVLKSFLSYKIQLNIKQSTVKEVGIINHTV